MSITMAIAPILYGLVYFLAWGDQFPTRRERLLWRVSSFVITFSGLVEVPAILGIKFWSGTETFCGFLSFIPMAYVAGMVPLAHILASVFLIVESFRQLAFLDSNSAAYQLPLWSNYWPHFS
jgi:hypothetical protein